jgi:hypothetical protein
MHRFMLLGDGLGLCQIVFSQKRKKKEKGFMPTYKLFIKDHYSPIYINFIGRGRWILGRGYCIIIIIIIIIF